MPMQTQKSSLFGKALKGHAKDEYKPREDFTELPGGIVGGVAELREAKLGRYQSTPSTQKSGLAGKRFLFLAGAVVEPEVAVKVTKTWKSNGKPGGGGEVVIVGEPERVKVRGLRTSLTLSLCDTKRNTKDGPQVVSEEQNVQTALNELKGLAPDCCDPLADLPANASEEQAEKALQGILDALKASRVRFRFSTESSEPTAQYPNPRTWHRWYGSEGVEQGNGEQTAEDAAAGVEEGDEAAPDETPVDEEPAAEGGEQAAEDQGVDALLEQANAGDEAAQQRLVELAVEAGYAQEDAWQAPSYDAVVEMINNPKTGDEGEAAAETPPAKGEVYKYQPVDPKTKKPIIDPKTKKPRAPVDCQVKAVDADKRTVDLLNSVDKKTLYKGVSWDALIRD